MIGCGSTRAIFVETGSIARIGPNVEGRIYVKVDGRWVLTDDTVKIPEGYYIVPPEPEKE
jgi:hypothetical protein